MKRMVGLGLALAGLVACVLGSSDDKVFEDPDDVVVDTALDPEDREFLDEYLGVVCDLVFACLSEEELEDFPFEDPEECAQDGIFFLPCTDFDEAAVQTCLGVIGEFDCSLFTSNDYPPGCSPEDLCVDYGA